MVGNAHLTTIDFRGKIVNEWQSIGYELEAKLTEPGTAIVRNQGQESEHPHLKIGIRAVPVPTSKTKAESS
jgi:hypothetical protein